MTLQRRIRPVAAISVKTHKGRARDRCKHAWWGSFRGKRVSLSTWTNREVRSKAEADKALDELTAAIRDGTFDERGLHPPPDNSPMTFGKFAEVYKQRHVLAKGLALPSTIDYRLKPLIERFGDRAIADIKTADIDDFVADLKQPRVVNGLDGRRLTPASINRTLGLLRHMLNWAVGREYLDRTPFRRGTEVLIRMELEDNKRRRRISEAEEAALLAVASPHLRSMIIAAMDTGMRRGEMLALRFWDIDRQPEAGGTSGSRRTAGGRQDVRSEDRSIGQTFKNVSRSHRTELRSKRRPDQGIRDKSLTACGMESWYRYGDSNPGPVAENHVS